MDGSSKAVGPKLLKSVNWKSPVKRSKSAMVV
jgi:hypothetical protein